MKTKLISLFLTLIISTGTIFAKVQIGYLYYNLNTNNQSAEVTSNSSGTYTGAISIPESIEYNSITYKVISIGVDAFRNCNGLTSITIGDSITSIGNTAFLHCYNLTSVTIPNNVTSIGESAFNGCSNLTSVTIGKNVTSIKEMAFNNCYSLTSVLWNAKNCHSYSFGSQVESFRFGEDVENIPASLCSGMRKLTSVIIPGNVTSIGEYAFRNCSSLTRATMGTNGNGIASIGKAAFENCSSLTSVTIPKTVISIGEYAFHGCSGLTSVSIGKNVKSIGDNAFEGCHSLKSLTIPNSITSIGNSTFSGCSDLKSLTIPNSITSIGNSAFSYCYDLKSLTIPNSVTSIGKSAFCSCTGLTSVTIGNGVTSIGSEAFRDCSGLTKVNITDIVAWCNIAFSYIDSNPLSCAKHLFVNDVEVTDLVIPDGVTNIENYAFSGCTGLKSVTIPNSVTSIGNYAFYQCSGLTSVTIGNSVTSIGEWAFSGCSGLTSVTIPNSVTSIGRYAFYNCSGLTSVTIGNSVTSIGEGAFSGCSGLTSIEIPNSVTSIGESAFRGCSSLTSVTIPKSVTSVGEAALAGCSGLTSVVWNAKSVNDFTSTDNLFYYHADGLTEDDIRQQITSFTFGNEVEVIPAFLFYGMKGLTTITVPNSVTKIGRYAFCRCSNLTSVTIGNSVTSIGGFAFSGCSSLTSITIPNSVTSIENYAFNKCSGLTSVTIGSGLPSIGWEAFLDCGSLTTVILNSNAIVSKTYSYDSTIQSIFGEQVTRYILGDEIKSIGDFAFYKCSNLTSVIISNSVTSIGVGVFENCSGLTSVTIPNSVTSIGGSAFSGCSSLTSVTIPNSVTSIGYGAFYGCSSLTSVTMESTTPPSMSGAAFDNFNKNLPKIYVPCGSLDAYKTADGWHSYYSKIQYVPAQYSITFFDSDYGQYDYAPPSVCDNELTAVPNEGYHFVSWADGNMDNPRTIKLTQDTVMEAIFAINTYNVTVTYNHDHGTVTGETGVFEHFSEITYEAIPNYGYHFSRWSDGKTANPRTITITGNTELTAIFEPNQYHISASCDQSQGSITGVGSYPYKSICSLEAVANYGYHFSQWTDGVTDNPRSFVLTQDTTFAAVFAVNQYSINVSCNNNMGTVVGENGTFDYLTEHTYEAISEYGYHFARWSDGSTNNPRTIKITSDTILTAIFEPNQYRISISCDSTQGYITGAGFYTYLSNCLLEAVPNYGYHFTQWTDGATDNPRSFVLTQDTTFAAVFAVNQYSINVSCDNNMGSVIGENGTFDYLTERTYEAIPNYGYHFVRWSDGETANPRTITLVKDITLSAEFSINLYLVQFFGYEDVLLDQQSVEHGKSAIAPNAPTVENYDFVGWDKDFNNVQSNLDVYAQYVKTIDAIEDINADQATTQKVLIDGQLFIIRDDKVYTLQGTEVK